MVEGTFLSLLLSRIDWVRKVALTVKCGFDFSLFPNDHQSCDVIPVINHYTRQQVAFNYVSEVKPL